MLKRMHNYNNNLHKYGSLTNVIFNNYNEDVCQLLQYNLEWLKTFLTNPKLIYNVHHSCSRHVTFNGHNTETTVCLLLPKKVKDIICNTFCNLCN